jgi:glycosyltransferase involved in cell wall biosynthesis
MLIGAVGNRNPQKGYELLLRAAAAVRDRIPCADLRIVGERSGAHAGYSERLDAQAARCGFGPDTLMAVPAGHQVAAIMPAFDVLVVSSVPLSEGIPTVLLEAMACAIPVVSTDVGAVREVVLDGVNGYVVPPGDLEGLTRAIEGTLRDGDLRAALGAAGLDLISNRWTLEQTAADHARAYGLAAERHEVRGSRR